MPRRTHIRSARVAVRNLTGEKKIARPFAKAKTTSLKLKGRELRFSVSLVLLMGMLLFSTLLLLFSLNKANFAKAENKFGATRPMVKMAAPNGSGSQVLNDDALDFRLMIPAQLGGWFYKIGMVQSLTDDSLSNQYLQIFVPIGARAKSSNFNDQNQLVLTIRKFSNEEWTGINKKCSAESKEKNKDICGIAGRLVYAGPDSNNVDWTYAATKPANCSKGAESKCEMADKIIQSFQMK